jgi:hypothetical protein
MSYQMMETGQTSREIPDNGIKVEVRNRSHQLRE